VRVHRNNMDVLAQLERGKLAVAGAGGRAHARDGGGTWDASDSAHGGRRTYDAAKESR
jgi:hypothetical protein